MGRRRRKTRKRARTTITYHGRRGKPVLHETKKGRDYIMVRAKGGGTKRLYLNTKKARKEIEGYKELMKEVRKG